jgi:predicted MPP superfamily phosphohydrolase
MIVPRKVRVAAAVIAVSAIALLAWALVLEPRSLTVREHALQLPRWPQACAGIRVAVVADLHAGAPFVGLDKIDRIVERVAAAHPDLVLLAGDYVIQEIAGGTIVAPEQIAEHLRPLKSPVYAVLGNHDWWLGGSRVRAALEAAGIPVLVNTHAEIKAGGCRFWLAGIDDDWAGHPDIAGAMAGIPPDEPIVVLTHNPDLFPKIPKSVVLTIAGHTHGGQVCLPFIGRPVVPSLYGQRFAAGHIIEDGKHLFVSTGIGTSIIPVRFRVPPEISLLELQPAVVR